MKKRGFSLAELLVAMSIIAIAAALLAPAYMRFKPDRYKFRVLNTYKFILETNRALLNNEDIYYQRTPDDNFDTYFGDTNIPAPHTQEGCIGLFCTEEPTDKEPEFHDTKYSGHCKYPNLMRGMLNLQDGAECNNGSTTYVASGRAADTSLWNIEEVFYDATQNQGRVGYRISVDLNPRNTAEQSCSYSSTCTHPDTFTFFVDRNGDIDLNYNGNGAMDELTKTYIRNMENIYKEDDLNQASQGG